MKNELVLKNAINRSLSDSISEYISGFTILGVLKNDPMVAVELLKNWEKQGLLEILLDELVPTKDPFVRMKSFIGMKSPIRGFLNWE